MSQIGAAALALGLCALPAAAFAQQSPAREALKRACTGDYMTHCSEHPPGGPEVEACFRVNIRKLTPGCATAITAYKQEQRATKRVSEAH